MNGEDLRPLAERSWALEDNTPGRLVDVHARIAAARRQRRSAIALVSVASVLVVLALTLVLVDTDPDGSVPDPAPTPSPSFTPAPTVPPGAAVHRPAEGTCWAVPAGQIVSTTPWPDDSPQVPCREQHTTETVAVLLLAEPTAAEAEKRAMDMCWEYVRLYVGIDQRSWIPWGTTAFLPSNDQIADGASWIRCDAMFPVGADWDQARVVTGSAEGLADDPPPEYWACFGSPPEPGSEPPPVPCDRPHAYEQTGRLALLGRLDEYPTKQEREVAEVQCEAGVPPRLRAYSIYVAWDPPDGFEPNGDVAGPCYVYDPSGSIPHDPRARSPASVRRVTNLLIRNARVVPLGAGETTPDAPVDIAVEHGVVTAVGPRLELSSGVAEIDAEGRWAIPGLWDQHTHLAQWTLSSQRLDLAGARSPEDATRMVAERIADFPDLPVIGWGHRSAGWHREVTVSELDAVSGDTAVVLISGDGHHAWLNTTALLHLAMPVRDSVVRETEWFAAYPRLVTLVGNDGTSPEAYRRMLEAAAAQGVTGMVDFEFGAGIGEWVERWAEGCDLLRIRAATYTHQLDEVIAAGLRTGDALPGCDDRATMGPLKIISDGSLNTRTAWCCEPYGDAHKLEYPSGQPNLSGAELREHLARAHAAGLEIATHAIGDAAVQEALAAYADTGAHGSIEHAQMARRDDVRRMAQLGIRASVQPAHLLDDRDLTDKIWGERAERCFAFRWMLDDGVELALGSDAPVSPLDPWLAMAAAVHRSADDRGPWHGEQALTVREALAASVDGQPTIGTGSRGDLVLLDRDPLLRDLDASDTAELGRALRAMPVALTTVAGLVVSDAR